MTQKSLCDILLNIPNTIGYIRILLLAISFVLFWLEYPSLFLVFYCCQALLDALDGHLARKFNQCTAFGAWMDVVIDNAGRTLLWTSFHPAFSLICCLEWITFSCTRNIGSDWKNTTRLSKPPPLLSWTMKNNFRSVGGVFAICGVAVLPIFLVATRELPGMVPDLVYYVIAAMLGLARVQAMLVEMWYVKAYLLKLLDQDLTITKKP